MRLHVNFSVKLHGIFLLHNLHIHIRYPKIHEGSFLWKTSFGKNSIPNTHTNTDLEVY